MVMVMVFQHHRPASPPGDRWHDAAAAAAAAAWGAFMYGVSFDPDSR
jgi:hypothetical protein